MRDDKVGFIELPIDREYGEKNAGDPADDEQRNEAGAKQQGRLEFNGAPPQRGYPVEDLHAGRHGDQERTEHYEYQDRLGDRRGKHVVRPREEAQEGDGYSRGSDRLVAKDGLAREHRQDLRDDAEAGQDQDRKS